MTKYSQEELEQEIKRLYPSPDFKVMTTALIQALAYLPRQDVDKLLNKSVIYIQGNISRRFDREEIRGSSIIILNIADLKDEKLSIITILHESAHEILNHIETHIPEEYYQQEAEAWNKVREWLPKEFHESINAYEKEAQPKK